MNKAFPLLFLLVFSAGCDIVTFRLHSKKERYLGRPHVLLLNAIIEFKESSGSWPHSIAELVAGRPEYQVYVQQLQYRVVSFVPRKNGVLKVYFSDYRREKHNDFPGVSKDAIDLNAIHATVRFYKSNGKYVYKVNT